MTAPSVFGTVMTVLYSGIEISRHESYSNTSMQPSVQKARLLGSTATSLSWYRKNPLSPESHPQAVGKHCVSIRQIVLTNLTRCTNVNPFVGGIPGTG